MAVPDTDPVFRSMLQSVVAGEMPVGVLADWLEERGDPRAAILRELPSIFASVLWVNLAAAAVGKALIQAFTPFFRALQAAGHEMAPRNERAG